MDHLSASQINLYLQCSLKYKFQYIDELPKPFRPSGLAFGSAFHAALSWFHNAQMRNGNGVSMEKLWKIFQADWYAQGLDTEILYKHGETETGLAVLAKELLRLYFARPETPIKGSEVSFVVPLVNPATGEELGMNLEGFIDLIASDDTIVEFKTSAQTMSSADVQNNLQLTAYSYAYTMLYQRPPQALKIIDFVKAKRPKMVVLRTSRTEHDHQRFFGLARQVFRSIRSHIFFPRTGWWCRGCEYAGSCKAWNGQ